jgi:thioredoxin reductase (NADPH)
VDENVTASDGGQSEEPWNEVYDVMIVGGGPAGATAALYAVRADLKTIVFDKGISSGALGTTSKIANYPGIPGPVPGVEILRIMRQQAIDFGARFVDDRVLSVDLSDEQKSVFTSEGFYRGRTLIIASGSMGRTQSAPGEERLLGRGVSYCATCDGAFFRDQEVAVVGGNDEALEEALFLTRFASRVHILLPAAEPRAEKHLVDQVHAQPKISLYPATRLREVLGEDEVEGIRTISGTEEASLPVAGVFIYLQGNRPITDFLGGQLPTTESGCLEVDEMMQTAERGVFAVGDVLCNHVKQAVISAAEGARAAMAAARLLSGRENVRPDWS